MIHDSRYLVAPVSGIDYRVSAMSLFFQPNIQSGSLFLDSEESRHAVQVLRMHEGEEIEITDGFGFFYSAKISEANHKKCLFEILQKREVQKKLFCIHLAIAPTKNADRMEWFVEKAVEIGIDHISFIHCQNSERKNINIERMEKIAVSAMKQSQQSWLPKISPLAPFKEIVKEKADQKFIGFVDLKNPMHLKSEAKIKGDYLVLIGPEGDFSNEELALALESGFQKVSLGANRLRTETAGITACQILNLINA